MTQTYFFKPPIIGVFCYLPLNAFLADKKHSEKVFEPSPKEAGVIQEKKNVKSTAGRGNSIYQVLEVAGAWRADTGSSSTMCTFQLLGQH